MENFINNVNIRNFKSITELKLEDCRRINIFIGYPNVGKSNVLEALGLFSLPFLEERENLKKLVRVKNAVELFNCFSEQYISTIDTDNQKIKIELNSPELEISIKKEETEMLFFFDNNIDLFSKGNIKYSRNLFTKFTSDIKRYIFSPNNLYFSSGETQLLPPFGENIIDVLSHGQNMADVREFIKNEFEKFGLQLVLNKKDKSFLVQQKVSKEMVLLLPYSSIADTLQRVIFFKTAIASNKSSILLFEEPEAHAFPPYIGNIIQDIIEAKNNQFFMATHSPLVINDFLEYEHLRQETSIFLFDFKNNQTTARRLTDEEMDEVYNYGIDLFFNIESFLE